MTKDQNTVAIMVIPLVMLVIGAFIWMGVKAKSINDQLVKDQAVAQVEQVANPLGIGEDVLITIAGVITNATPDEVAAAHDLIVKTVSDKLGTNGLKCIYVEFR
jgi:hypothetical protein